MKRVLLTGMSCTGKSSVLAELSARGYKAVDTGDGYSEPQPDGRQLWRENAVEELLATEDAVHRRLRGEPGDVPSAVRPHRAAERAARNTGRAAGDRDDQRVRQDPEELRRSLEDVETVEPLLRRAAHHEVVMTAPLDDVVATVLRLVGEEPG